MTQLHTWKCVFTADHPLQAATMATALEAEGLTPQLRGMELWGVAVEILFSEGAAPSVWVPAMQEAQAQAIVERMRQAATPKQQDWQCQHCSEKVPASFESCWQCGNERPAAAATQASAGITTSEGK
jgi:membrane protease subunit (stomatin/prohibitin family)